MARTRKYSDPYLKEIRKIPLTTALDALGLYWKIDHDYKPILDKSSIRINVSLPDGGVRELRITKGIRFYDMRTKLGGGGVIDLVKYLYSVEFPEAMRIIVSKIPMPKKETEDSDGANVGENVKPQVGVA